MKYFVRVGENRIKAFSEIDARKLAAKTGGTIVRIPVTR